MKVQLEDVERVDPSRRTQPLACDVQVEILEIEERKNNHINELMKKHEKAFGEIKNYCASSFLSTSEARARLCSCFSA